MARRALAPTHDLCARMRFIPAEDSAWDSERIEAECKVLGKAASHPETGHVFARYQAGLTRYDLDADGVGDYLDFAKKPETWLFRRLDWDQREQIAFIERQGRHEAAMMEAFLHGVVGLENPSNSAGAELAKLLAIPERTPEVRTKISAAAVDYASSAIVEVGDACRRGSQDLTPQEKKLSDSPHGPTSRASSTEA